MSLFQAREWWAARSETDEEYDNNSLVVCNIDNAADGYDKVITGSLSGTLKIWRPGSAFVAGREAGLAVPSFASRVEDLMFEEHLPSPIIALAAGRFSRHVRPLNTLCLFVALLIFVFRI